MKASLLVALTGLGLLACDGDPVNTSELEAALATTRTTPTAGAPAGPPPGLRTAGAGAHSTAITLRYRLDGEDGTRTRLWLQRAIHVEPDGRFRVDEMRDWSDSREGAADRLSTAVAIYDGQRFVMGQGWGPWRARETWAGQHWDFLLGSFGVIDVAFQLVEPYLKTRVEDGPSTLRTIELVSEALQLDETVVPKRLSAEVRQALRQHEDTWVRWFAATHRPLVLDGWRLRRKDNGEIVGAQMRANGEVTDGAHTAEFQLLLSVQVEDLSADLRMVVPEGAEVLPAHRPRVWAMIEDVLGDRLRPPYRRDGTKGP